LALEALFWRVTGTILGTVPPATYRRHYPDLLSQLNDPPKRSDGIVETCRENGCFKKLEEILKAMGSP
jgi:hypothetical protein